MTQMEFACASMDGASARRSHATAQRVAQVRELLRTLDRRQSYFTITHFAELLRDEQIMIPCDLKVHTAASTVNTP